MLPRLSPPGSVAGRPGGTLGTERRLDHVRARFISGPVDNDIPRIPPMGWGGPLVYQHDRVYGRCGFMCHESQWDANGFEYDPEDFVPLDLVSRVSLPVFENHAATELTFPATDLLDVDARNAVSSNKDEVELPGPDFRMGLRREC